MIGKEAETHVVVINFAPLKRGYYKVELGDAAGEIYELDVHEETVLDYRLVIGKELDKATFEKLKNSMGYQKAYSYAIGILGNRLYTEKEIRRKLDEKETDKNVIEDVVAKLFEIGLLDDVAYARIFIENQVEIGKKSRRRIVSDLDAKGVGRHIIDDLGDLFDRELEDKLIVKEIEKAYQRFVCKDLNDFELRHKVIQTLGRKGFDLQEVQRQYGFFIEDLAVADNE